MSEEKSIFDFDTIKEFSGLIIRKLSDDEALFIAVLDTQVSQNEFLDQEPQEPVFLNLKEIDAIRDNEELIFEIKKQTKVYEFSKLDISYFIRTLINITADQENRYCLNVPVRRYLLKGQGDITLLDEHDNSFII